MKKTIHKTMHHICKDGYKPIALQNTYVPQGPDKKNLCGEVPIEMVPPKF
jgi:hypothetical protein